MGRKVRGRVGEMGGGGQEVGVEGGLREDRKWGGGVD